MEPIVYLNGQFVPLSQAKVSILDRGFCYGDALFETLRVYSGKIFHLDWHLDRLEQGARAIHLDLPHTRRQLEEILYQTYNRNQGADAVIRMTVTRGEGILGQLWQADTSPTLSVYVRPYSGPSQEWYQNGVPISLVPGSATRIGSLDRQIKSANYLSQILARKQAEEQDSVDGIMINPEGEVCDGTICNIFLVRNGTLVTPAVNGYVLAGVTRQVVLTLAGREKLPCEERTVSPEEVLSADEVFVTNTGWEVLPVSWVDGQSITEGRPGPVTCSLRQAFRNYVEAEMGK